MKKVVIYSKLYFGYKSGVLNTHRDIEILKQYADEQGNIKIVDIFADYKGNIFNFINEENRTKIDVILVETFRDISTSAIKFYEIISKLEEYGIEVISKREQMSSKDLDFYIKMHIYKFFEEEYNKMNRSERMKKLWKDPTYRKTTIAKMKKAKELKIKGKQK